LFNSGSNCEMDIAAAYANDGKTVARQTAQQTFLDPLETLTRLR